MLTRSLPWDVYVVRRKNDHPGGQGRIYTSNLNFVFTHLSKPGHRRGCCCMFHKRLHSRPEPLRDLLFPFAHTTSSRCRRKPLQLLLPQARTTRYRESFFYRSALLWNSLPQDIQAHTNSTTFRKAIEQHWSAHRYTTAQNIPIPLSSALSYLFNNLHNIHTHCLSL